MTTDAQAERALVRAADQIGESTSARDRWIRLLHTRGYSLRAIADLARLSHGGVKKIIDR